MISFIQAVFKQHLLTNNSSQTQKMAMALRQSILKNAFEEAVCNYQSPSRLFQQIESIPMTLSLDEKLSWLSKRLLKHAAMPVITVHPTNVLSNQSLFQLTHITDDLMQLYINAISDNELADFKSVLTSNIINWAKSRLVPKQHLTPEDEAEYALFLYQRVLASFPEFRKEVVNHFIDVYGGSEDIVITTLNKALTKSYRNIFSWCMADFDGNHNRTRKTIANVIYLQNSISLTFNIIRKSLILELNKLGLVV